MSNFNIAMDLSRKFEFFGLILNFRYFFLNHFLVEMAEHQNKFFFLDFYLILTYLDDTGHSECWHC